MHTIFSSQRFGTGPHHQQGMVAMFVAIIVLIATMMAAVALMRSTDTSNMIAGSLTFRQGVLQEAARAYEASKAAGAVPFFPPQSNSDDYAVGYSSLILPSTTKPGIPDVLANATTGTCTAPCLSMTPLAATGNTVRYVVERLCPMTGPADKKACLVPGATVGGGQTTDSGSDPGAFRSAVLPAYRLTVRVDGPKNTVGYVQSILR